MSTRQLIHDRRCFLRHVALGAAFFTVPGLFAEELTQTPRQTDGPFYPDHLPLDTDNDLLVINDGITPAVGDVTYVSGRPSSISCWASRRKHEVQKAHIKFATSLSHRQTQT